ncbi:hypothetical protein [Pseudoponticoccus marisrubri]|uniref:Uncharacterized protein n=1 Tax=Pseudoponticoccus marisrubri TaxID=1685382 RepID=A0A0W7WDS7_9RHOB|nr:hypothetical protein [Pseudoponticoccus marisrubri]KUF08664.1 hypothetical protein AVJ23_21560 [Pseudoponticoccus marisrubri]
MAATLKRLVPRIGTLCRTAAVALIAGVCRWRSIREINDAIRARPVQQQAAITLGVFALLFVLGLVAAQFGWVGMLVFWLAVIVIVN